MVHCIFCGGEFEGLFRDHMVNKHFKAAPSTIPEPPKPLPIEEPQKEMPHDISPGIPAAEKHDPPAVPLEKPKRRYLTGGEIITLLQNTNKQFPINQLEGCPLTKENE